MQSIKKYSTEILVLIVFVFLAVLLNLQLLQGSNLHHEIGAHDEYITVRQVYNILEPASAKHWFMAIISGEKLYYGRVMFYTDAAIAFVPYKIWGVEGMVFAIRMTHAILLVFSFFILARTFINNHYLRLAFYIFACLGLYTVYFAMLPKPEPFQVFFLALFLMGWKRSNYTMGMHFVWLGLAYGVKFNVLFLVPVFLILAYYSSKKKGDIATTKQAMLLSAKTLGWLLLGFVIAIPCMALVPIKPQFWHTYLDHTFFNTTNPDDDPSITWGNWLFGIYGFYYWGRNFLLPIFFILFALGSVGVFFQLRKDRMVKDGLVLWIVAIVVFLPILFFTKRLWPHYLWEGHIFFLLFFLVVFGNIWVKGKRVSQTGLVLLVGAQIFAAAIFILQRSAQFFELDRRYANEMTAWRSVQNYIASHKSNAHVAQDIAAWYPFSEYVKVNRYHPFQGSLPQDTSQFQVVWELPANPSSPALDCNYIVLSESSLDPSIEEKPQEKVRAMNAWKAKMRLAVNVVWVKDTAINGMQIYVKK